MLPPLLLLLLLTLLLLLLQLGLPRRCALSLLLLVRVRRGRRPWDLPVRQSCLRAWCRDLVVLLLPPVRDP